MTASPAAATFPRRVLHRDLLWLVGSLVLSTAAGGGLLLLAVRVLDQSWYVGYFVPVTAALGVLALWLAARRRRWSWRDLGVVRGRRSPWHLVWEVPIAWLAAVIPAIAGVTAMGLQPSRQSDAVTLEALRLGPVAVALTLVSVALVVPFLEEIVFRRVIFGWIEGRAGWALAILGSTLCFAAAHVVPAVMVIAGSVGLAAGVLVRLHRSLLPGLVLHGANNLLVTVLVLGGLR